MEVESPDQVFNQRAHGVEFTKAKVLVDILIDFTEASATYPYAQDLCLERAQHIHSSKQHFHHGGGNTTNEAMVEVSFL